MKHHDYTVGWICALPIEMAVARAMLDERHESLPQDRRDHNNYTLGRIGPHNVAIACLPTGLMGVTSAARVAEHMSWTFTSLRFRLMVGIGGGVPSAGNDIRLGDVVVSHPLDSSPAVIQYDYGKTVEDGRFERTGSLNQPPDELMRAVASLRAAHLMEEPVFPSYLLQMASRYPLLRAASTALDSQEDLLFEPDYSHVTGEETCVECEVDRLVSRPRRAGNIPVVHYGLIASGNQVMKDGETRERLRQQLKVICFEMEAAGLMNSFPCLVIRGICDYADTHKNKQWQPYAAATAAAYAKELLNTISGIQAVDSQVMDKATPVVEPTRVINSIPFPRDRGFIRRESILSQIENRIQQEYCVPLCGMGGVGKSQIAIEYAYQYRENHPQSHIFWVYAADMTRFAQAYQDIARQLKLPGSEDPKVDISQLVSNWLADEVDVSWLMIVDNADDPALFLHDTVITETSTSSQAVVDYLPKKLDANRCMIVTTRNQQVGEALAQGEPCIDVGPFSVEESVELLRSKVHKAVSRTDEPVIEKLVNILGRIPLAITQAVAYMNRNRISMANYLAALEKNNQNLVQYLSNELQDHRRAQGYPNSIFQTWRLSFEQIRLHDARAAEILSLMAMLDGQQIPHDLAQRDDERDIDFQTALGTLAGYSLVMPVGEQSWTMHALVQLSVQDWLTAANQKTKMTEEALRLVARRFPTGEHENKATCEALIPHAQAVLRHASGLNSIVRDYATLLYNVGWFDWQQGRYMLAQENLQKSYDLQREAFGDYDVPTMHSLGLLALVLQYQGIFKQAEEMHRQELRLNKKVLGKEHPGTLTSMHNLARALKGQGKYEQAEEMFRRVIRLSEKVLGKEHPDTLTSMGNLAGVLNELGKYEQTEVMHRKALRLRKKVLGKEHPDTLESMGDLAWVLNDQGKYEQAEVMHRQVLRLRGEVLGKEHPETLTSMRNLARALNDQGKYEQAEVMHRQVLRLREKFLGKEHPDTLTSMGDLATVLNDQGEYQQAEMMHRQALRLSEKVLGKEHPDTLTSMHNLGGALNDQGKYEQAEEMHRQALRLSEKFLGKEHPHTLTSMQSLASVYQNQKRLKEAEALRTQAMEMCSSILGQRHPHTLTSMNNLAYTWKSLGRDEEAISLMKQANRLEIEVLGVDHPHTKGSSHILETWLA